MTHCPYCHGPHTLSQCPRWKVGAAIEKDNSPALAVTRHGGIVHSIDTPTGETQMQTTQVSAYSIKMLLKQNARGIRVVGYTVKPSYGNGLNMTNRKQAAGYVGFAGK